jgi:hypothetical protein
VTNIDSPKLSQTTGKALRAEAAAKSVDAARAAAAVKNAAKYAVMASVASVETNTAAAKATAAMNDLDTVSQFKPDDFITAIDAAIDAAKDAANSVSNTASVRALQDVAHAELLLKRYTDAKAAKDSAVDAAKAFKKAAAAVDAGPESTPSLPLVVISCVIFIASFSYFMGLYSEEDED